MLDWMCCHSHIGHTLRRGLLVQYQLTTWAHKCKDVLNARESISETLDSQTELLSTLLSFFFLGQLLFSNEDIVAIFLLCSHGSIYSTFNKPLRYISSCNVLRHIQQSLVSVWTGPLHDTGYFRRFVWCCF